MGGGGVENDSTFDDALYTRADPESFRGVDAILNQFECELNVKAFNFGNWGK